MAAYLKEGEANSRLADELSAILRDFQAVAGLQVQEPLAAEKAVFALSRDPDCLAVTTTPQWPLTPPRKGW